MPGAIRRGPPAIGRGRRVLFVGSKGMLIAEYGKFKLYPEDKFADVRRPQLFPRSIHHAQEWITACKTGSPTGTNFDYSGPLTETVLLGTVAYRDGRYSLVGYRNYDLPQDHQAMAALLKRIADSPDWVSPVAAAPALPKPVSRTEELLRRSVTWWGMPGTTNLANLKRPTSLRKTVVVCRQGLRVLTPWRGMLPKRAVPIMQ